MKAFEDSKYSRLLTAAGEAHAACDRFVGGWQNTYTAVGGEIFCHSGCANCCTLAVNCTFGEALVIAEASPATVFERLGPHVQTLSSLAQAAPTLPAWLRTHRAESGGCPFLSADGTCAIYALRPLTCRALLATREPRWCAADFSALSSDEKQAFMASLDRSVVAFPMHYVAATREYAEMQERELLCAMADQYGFALYGSLPVLVWLARERQLGSTLSAGLDATRRLLADCGLGSPFLATMVEGSEIVGEP